MSERGAVYTLLAMIAHTCHQRKVRLPKFLLAALRQNIRTGMPMLHSKYIAKTTEVERAA